jgi:enolase-phosphatase E1
MSQLDNVRGILLDIEGTTTPISFVHDVLFTYAREHAGEFLQSNAGSPGVLADLALLREEHQRDVKDGRKPPRLTDDRSSITAYIDWLISLDRKSTGLKSLQGKIWQQGYRSGTLKSQVFADVPRAFERWRDRGLTISIFSSGSVLAQQLLFAHTEVGDLTRFIKNYFDTNTGKKAEAESYRRIAQALGLPASEIIFASDVVSELNAAKEAGMKTLLSIRPGNCPQQNTGRHNVVQSFDLI